MRRRAADTAPAHPRRAADLRAALAALDVVPIAYAGTVRQSGTVHAVMTRATVDALTAAASRVSALLDTRDVCRTGRGTAARHVPCEPCAEASAVWWRWRHAALLNGGDAWWNTEPHRAMWHARQGRDWPHRYIREWQHWHDQLPGDVRQRGKRRR